MRRMERILNDTPHPCAVWHTHVGTQRGCLIQRHAEQIVSLADLEHLNQIWNNPAIWIFCDDHRFSCCEAGYITIPGGLSVTRIAHLSNDQIDLWLHCIVPVSNQVEEIARDQHISPFLASVLAGIVRQLTEVAENLSRLIAVIFAKKWNRLTIIFEVKTLG